MRKMISICVLLSMLIVLIPPPTGAALTMHQNLSTADIKITSFAGTGGLGYSVAMVGDVNGDGYDDYMSVDNLNDSNKGDAYLFYGRNSSFPTSAAQANVTFHSENVSGLIDQVAGIGDVNGDGFDDVMIGASGENFPVNTAGAAYIFFGSPGGWGKFVNVSSAPAIIRGVSVGDRVGQRMAGVGDVNGDRLDDLVLGCYNKDTWGVAYLFLGKHVGSPAWNISMNLTHAAASFHGKEAKSFAGDSLAGGDVNGDGLNDIIIGSPGDDNPWGTYKSPGYIYVVFGRTVGWAKNVDLSTSANASLMGEHYDDYAGQNVAVPGDVNGDGFEDIIMGTVHNDEAGNSAGKAYLYLGRSNGWALGTNLSGADASWRGEAAGDLAGVPLSGAGDVNGDSLADFMIGAKKNTDQGLTGQGQVYLFLGKKAGWAKNQNINTADASWLGEANNDAAPTSLSGKGDVNGDVLDDLLIGVQKASPPGKTYLVFPVKNSRPKNITKVDLFMDAAFTKHATYVKLHDQIFVRLKAQDMDPTNINFEQVRIKSTPHDPIGFVLDLAETGANTGIFTGNFFVQNFTQPDLRWIKALPICKVRVEAIKNISAYDEISVGGVLRVDSITVLPGGSPTLYAMKQSYSIRVNVTDNLGNAHIGGVFLYLPYDTGKVNFSWYHDSNSFHTITNPDQYVGLDTASSASNPSQNRSVVTFKVYFNWTFPDELYHMVEATVETKDADMASMNVTDAYRVEKHLDFYGNLKMTGNHGRLLSNGVPLAPGENITMTNVIVVYKGTTNVYPPDTQFSVVGIDSDGNNWASTAGSGAFIWVTATSSMITNLHYNVTLDILGPPHACINRTIKVSFSVDAGQVAFSDPEPSQGEWQSNKRVNARVNISDAGGSLVNANSIEYRTKLNGAAQWGPWTNAQLTGLLQYIDASILVDLKDGPMNLIQWRATNGVGNLDANGNKTTSTAYIIKVDTVPPVFSNPWPGTGNVSKKTNVSFGIRVTDLFSEVNGDSIEYTVSTDNQTTWTNWTKAIYTGSKQVFDCIASWTFQNTSLNFVRWKATDNVGNLVMSDPVQIVVNTTPPPPPNRKPVLQPIADKTVNMGSVLTFQANATDPDKDPLTFSLIEHPQGMVITPKGLLTFAPTKDQVGVQNVTIMVSDGKLNDTVSFKVTVVLQRPIVTLNNPAILQGELKGKVTLTGTASGGVQGIAKVEYCVDDGTFASATGTTSWSIVLKTTDFKDGQHKLTVKVTDGLGTTNSTNYDFTVKNKGKTNGGMSSILPIIIAIVVVIVVLGIIGAVLMMRKKKKPEQVPPNADQQPAGTTPPTTPPK